MKLYTEEQLLNTVKSIRHYDEVYDEKVANERIEKHLKALQPIELPSDEEILIPFPTEEDENFRDGKEIKNWMNGWGKGYKEALQAIRNKIQGGNND